MRTILSVAIAAAVVALGSGCCPCTGASQGRRFREGKTLVDAKGMTLYILDRDTTANKSTCNAQCATNWPPLMASGDAKDNGAYTVITRDDGASSGPTRASRCISGRTTRRPATPTATAATTSGISPRPDRGSTALTT